MKSRIESRARQTPWDETDGNKVRRIFSANSAGKLANPCAGNFSTLAAFAFAGDPLHKICSSERRTKPVLPGSAHMRSNRLIHQVVTEHRGAAVTNVSNG